MAQTRVTNRETLEDLEIMYKNFAGDQTAFNNKGDRNFSLRIPDRAMADRLRSNGWAVRLLNKRDEEEPDCWHLPVAVSYAVQRPLVYKITSAGKLPLSEETIEVLDFHSIKFVDAVLNPYNWTVNGKSGVKAYLHSLYATVEETPLDLKYADFQDLGG